MKFKFAVLSIVATTCGLIGLLYALINQDDMISGSKTKTSVNAPPHQTSGGRPTNHGSIGTLAAKESAAKQSTQQRDFEDDYEDDEFFDDEDDEEEEDDDFDEDDSFAELDKKSIEEVTSLSDDELNQQFNSLKQELEQKDLITQLESGKLDDRGTEEAKKTLERFSLLGLENTRRKFASIEPELGNKENAHRESLREIRSLLNNY